MQKTIKVFYNLIEQCPPSNAKPINGDVFLIVNCDGVVTADCFKTMYERETSRKRPYTHAEECQSRGLSYSVTREDAEFTRNSVSSLKKKKILHGIATHSDGVMLDTTNKHPRPHFTWWVDKSVEEIWLRFSLVGDSK